MAGALKGMKEDIAKALAGLMGTDEATAEQIAATGLGQSKALGDAAAAAGQGTGQKDGGEEPPAAGPEGETTVSDDDLALALANALLANHEMAEQAVEQGKAIKLLTDEMASLRESVKALSEADEQRKALLPRAVVQALAQRASEKGTAVEPGAVDEDAKKQAAALSAQGAPDAASDPFGWFASKAGLQS